MHLFYCVSEGELAHQIWILWTLLLRTRSKEVFNFFFLKYLFIYLLMAVLGLRFCARAFSSCGKWGPLFIAVRGPLTIAASLVAEHRLQTCRLSNCGSRAQLLRSMWDLPGPGLEHASPALAGRFPTTAPPGKPRRYLILKGDTGLRKILIMVQVFGDEAKVIKLLGKHCSG